ncbi:T9SS type A sorting domain-containing protein [Lacinutrix sp. Bg11-31]|uniref:T9SS type A sorting domain-containing protein n=1 Tax=Lacinutrix sp. Bg11-31 TaxID=2057808 RepID=UPI000C30B821|nr:T9SS type A sorting domain-containing protein [Lacinutrix sp. Bg11-31]AUC83150.1 hypothetical protein CW733_13825 [Lacinutrix sp. Bg11-31]
MPNPTSETIKINANFGSEFRTSVLDLNGRVLLSNIKGKTINVSQFADGIYLLIIQNNDKKITKRIVVKK